jgi:hypothetical protein
MKFNSGPINTVTMLEYVDSGHTPWLTICPNPGVNFTRLEELYAEYERLIPKLEKFKKLPVFGAEPIDFGMLAYIANRTGRGFGGLVGQVLLPPWSYLDSCKIVLARVTDTRGADGNPTSCNLLKYRTGETSKSSYCEC